MLNAAEKLRQVRRGWGWWLMVGALAVYLFTRWYAIADYPIYFFTDEAIQTLLAQDLLRDGLRSPAGELLPTYFYNVYQYNLGPSVYLQVIPALFLRRSVEVTRGTAALATLLAPFWLGLAMHKVYRRPDPWLVVLWLGLTPAWFLHSRTAFECSLAVTFYCGLLYFYLRYRGGQAEALYGAVICGVLAFYTYSPAQVVVPVTGLLFLISDWGYHRQNRAILLRAAGLGLVCGLPYLRFQVLHPGESARHLAQVGSYLIQAMPWTDKIAIFIDQYLQGLNPVYWYGGLTPDLERHTMDGLGHLLTLACPVGIAAVTLAAWRVRRWEYRVPLLAILAVPSGAALVGAGITRLLFMVAPVTLLSALWVSEGLERIASILWGFKGGQAAPTPRPPLPLGRGRTIKGMFLRPAGRKNTPFVPFLLPLRVGVGLIFLAGNFALLRAALVDGPTWSTQYGMIGMQWGARQVFGEVLRYAMKHRGTPMIVSPTWTNGADVVARFFWPDPPPAQLEGIAGWLSGARPLDDAMVFVLPAEEYECAQNSGKFDPIRVEKVLFWPDGRPGFYFVHLRYASP